MLISHLASMVIREFNIVCITIFKAETYAPLIVDGNGVLPLSFPLQFMKSITWRYFQILQPGRHIEIFQSPLCPPSNIRRKSFRPPRFVQLQRLLVGKRLYHALSVICHVTHVNRRMKSPHNVTLKLRAEGRACCPRPGSSPPPSKKREPQEPSASACC